MIIVSGTKFHFHWVNAPLALCLYSVLNVKAEVAAFNQEKALVGAFSVIVKSSGTFGKPSFEALGGDGGALRKLLLWEPGHAAWEPQPPILRLSSTRSHW